MLREQNTFWKKYLSLTGNPANQVTMKTKFSAGELKKKLFGGVGALMTMNKAAPTSYVETHT